MRVIVVVESDGEEILSAKVDMDEKVFFSLRYGDEVEIDFDDPKTESKFCIWYEEPPAGLFRFEVFEISNSKNNWHCEKRKEPEYVDHIICIVDSYNPISEEE